MPTTRRAAAPKRRVRRGAPADDSSSTKTTRAEAADRRLPDRFRSAGARMGRVLDACPDRIDVRDWFYEPRLVPLPDQIDNRALVPQILDQGQEGACTGFALAAVINFLLRSRNLTRSVSPRMLYEMARKYDEWPGERYEGSSARGGMIGFVRHGVCDVATWPLDRVGSRHLTPAVAANAMQTPGGAYYRLQHQQVRDVHAALAEVGIVYMTLMVHGGWQTPEMPSGGSRSRELAVIARQGRADSGHAVAIVGYTRDGFIIQNSWGHAWGTGGFALLPYEDYLMHATDVWAVQLGVPVAVDLWDQKGYADVTAGRQRAAKTIPLADIRPFVVDVGNNGELSDSGNYWTTEDDLQRLFAEMIPQAAEAGQWQKKRVMLYFHGGLNDEVTVARRIVAFRDVFLANGIYPLHVMWESGFWDVLKDLFADLKTDVDDRAGGVAEWWRKTRDALVEAKDRTIEITTARPGRAVWDEMKENAKLASKHPKRRGGMQLLVKYARQQLAKVDPAAQRAWELHVVAHSAGSIFVAHAIDLLAGLGVSFKTLQFFAPAATAQQFCDLILPAVDRRECPHPTSYVLSDSGERDDTLGPYGKSLLYLVSNAFEPERETPLVGLEKFIHTNPDSDPQLVDPDLERFFAAKVDGLPSLVVSGAAAPAVKGEDTGNVSRSDSHGGFDNDVDTMNSVLFRILGRAPEVRFDVRNLQF